MTLNSPYCPTLAPVIGFSASGSLGVLLVTAALPPRNRPEPQPHWRQKDSLRLRTLEPGRYRLIRQIRSNCGKHILVEKTGNIL